MSLGNVAKWPRVIRSVGYAAGRGLSVDLVASEVTHYHAEVRLDAPRKTLFITLHEKDGAGDRLRIEEKHVAIGEVPGLRGPGRYALVVQDARGQVLKRATLVVP